MFRYFVSAPLFLIACLLHAQEFRGTIQGDVTDPSRAAVTGASILLKNIETDIERVVLSDGSGHYLFTFVAPGSYSVTVKAAGFKTTVRDNVRLSISDNLNVDIDLPLGQASETVQVSGELTTVQSESSSLGSVISEKTVTSLPWKGHSSLFM